MEILILLFLFGLLLWGIQITNSIQRLAWLENLTIDDPVKFKIEGITYVGTIKHISGNASVAVSVDGDTYAVFTNDIRKVSIYDYKTHKWSWDEDYNR